MHAAVFIGWALVFVGMVAAVVSLVRYDDQRRRWDKPEPRRELAKDRTVRRGR